jgi:hypothetical protein
MTDSTLSGVIIIGEPEPPILGDPRYEEPEPPTDPPAEPEPEEEV